MCLTILEDFPDELLLLMCRYLSSTEVLFSFYGLNSRLTRMISEHFGHVVMAQIPYKRFQTICSAILPDIGSIITSMVLSNKWKGVLSKMFIGYFGDRMSSIFPNLERLILISFNDRSLTSFLDTLQNLSKLHEIHIHHMYQITDETMQKEKFFDRILTTNNHRFDSIFFDDDSMIFSFPDGMINAIYSNIRRLSIDLKTINDLHRIFNLLPELISINAAINNDTTDLKIDQNTPMIYLKQFQLQSFGPAWKLEYIASILERLPHVEQLSIAIEIYKDLRLMNGEEIHPLISNLPLKQFRYFLRYYDNSKSIIDQLDILPSWHQFHQEFLCVKSDDGKMLILYTLPFVSEFLILPNVIATNRTFLRHYAPQVEIFTLTGMNTNTADVFTIIQQFRRLTNLYLRVTENNSSDIPKDLRLPRLPYLTKLTALRKSSLNQDCLEKLLEISPNLYNLEINYELLQKFIDHESICTLLKHRITHIYILIPKGTDTNSFLMSISTLPKRFPLLRHIYFCFEEVSYTCELSILRMLKYLSQWKSLVSFGLVGSELKEKIIKENLQQWIVDIPIFTI